MRGGTARGCGRASGIDPARRVEPFEEAVCADEVHDQARPAEALAGGEVPQCPLDGGMADTTAGGALAAVRARRPGADLEAGEDLDPDLEPAVDAGRASATLLRSVEKPIERGRKLLRSEPQLDECSCVCRENGLEPLVIAEESRLREGAGPHPALELLDADGCGIAIRRRSPPRTSSRASLAGWLRDGLLRGRHDRADGVGRRREHVRRFHAEPLVGRHQ